MITVLIADDHPLFRHGLVSLLSGYPDIKVVGEAGDGVEAVARATELQPAVVIMDLRMPGGDGVEATADLRSAAPSTMVLVLTASEDDEDLFEAMRLGARGYILKYAGLDELVGAVRAVALGDVIISPAMAKRLVDHLGPAGEHHLPTNGDREGLTLRELEVLRRVSTGASNSQIAAQLNISEATVKAHLRNIMEKLEVKNRAQAVAKAINGGLLRR
ncbi:MAG: hypothetical protein A2147_03315 [Chloroflexi bacterium RBG_16_57_8]|nr:MAG: hypothetical protein A2147_03315 [Chloroflexi bacterium RBG_16_57_8]